jgi:hypothetical protein
MNLDYRKSWRYFECFSFCFGKFKKIPLFKLAQSQSALCTTKKGKQFHIYKSDALQKLADNKNKNNYTDYL